MEISLKLTQEQVKTTNPNKMASQDESVTSLIENAVSFTFEDDPYECLPPKYGVRIGYQDGTFKNARITMKTIQEIRKRVPEGASNQWPSAEEEDDDDIKKREEAFLSSDEE